MKGLMIVLEGIDGAGKTTVGRLLWEKLRLSYNLNADDILLTQEPWDIAGAPAYGDLFYRGFTTDASRFFGFLANRIEHIKQVIHPWVYEQGKVLICDRFDLSTLVYQQEMSEMFPMVVKYASGDVAPDLGFWLNADPSVAVARLGVDAPDFNFLALMDTRYREAASKADYSQRVTDNLSPEEVAEALLNRIKSYLAAKQSSLRDWPPSPWSPIVQKMIRMT